MDKGWIHQAYDRVSTLVGAYTNNLEKLLEPASSQKRIEQSASSVGDANSIEKGLQELVQHAKSASAVLGVEILFASESASSVFQDGFKSKNTPSALFASEHILDQVVDEAQTLVSGVKKLTSDDDDEYYAQNVGIVPALMFLVFPSATMFYKKVVRGRSRSRNENYSEKILRPFDQFEEAYSDKSASARDQFQAFKNFSEHLSNHLGESVVESLSDLQTLIEISSMHNAGEEEVLVSQGSKRIQRLSNQLVNALRTDASSHGIVLSKDEALVLAKKIISKFSSYQFISAWTADPLRRYARRSESNVPDLIKALLSTPVRLDRASFDIDEVEWQSLKARAENIRLVLSSSLLGTSPIRNLAYALNGIGSDAYQKLLRGELKPEAFVAEVKKVAVEIFAMDSAKLETAMGDGKLLAKAQVVYQLGSLLKQSPKKPDLFFFIRLVEASISPDQREMDLIEELSRLCAMDLVRSQKGTRDTSLNRVLKDRLSPYLLDAYELPQLSVAVKTSLVQVIQSIREIQLFLLETSQWQGGFREAADRELQPSIVNRAKVFIKTLANTDNPEKYAMTGFDEAKALDLREALTERIRILNSFARKQPRTFYYLMANAERKQSGVIQALRTATYREASIDALVQHMESSVALYQTRMRETLRSGTPREKFELIKKLIGKKGQKEEAWINELAHSYTDFLDWLKRSPLVDERMRQSLLDELPHDGSLAAHYLEDVARLDLLFNALDKLKQSPSRRHTNLFFRQCALMLAGDYNGITDPELRTAYLEQLRQEVIHSFQVASSVGYLSLPSHLGYGESLQLEAYTTLEGNRSLAIVLGRRPSEAQAMVLDLTPRRSFSFIRK